MNATIDVIVLFTLLLGLVSTDNDHVFSVTSFPDLERFYLKAREHQVLDHHFSFEKPMWRTVKARDPQSTPNFCICKSILSSTHFKHRDIYPLNWEDSNVKTEIKIFHPAIYEEFYQTESQTQEKMKQCSQESEGDSQERSEEEKNRIDQESKKVFKVEVGTAVDENQLVYTLPYVNEYPVSVFSQDLPEGLVYCLARTLKPYNVKPYFVSLAYRPHRDASDEQKMYFVFRISSSEVVLEALAEEVAVSTKKLTSVEKNYLKKRWFYDAKPTTSHRDPICSLSATIKLRICASIVASAKYREELEFVPVLENVFETCHMRDVFLYELSLRGGNMYGSEGLSEWMYGCRARRVGSLWRSVHLYVSRSYDNHNSVFVYKVINGRYEMADYFENVLALYRQ